MRNKFSLLSLFLSVALLAHAHFVFVVPESGNASAKVFISEELKPDGAVDIGLVSAAKLSLRESGGRETPLSLTKGSDAYFAALSGSGDRVIHGIVDLGFSQEGRPGKPFLLIYHPKTILGNAFDPKSALGADVPTELVPSGKAGAVTLKLLAHGKPQPNAEVTVILPDGSQKKVKTDASGQTETFTASGRYGAWARYWEDVTGERGGKKYEQLHHYATLVFDTASTDSRTPAITASRFATLPQAVASFGAVADNGWLYIYGGHVSRTHSYSTEAVSGEFHRLNLALPGTWEDLPSGTPIQGMNLAADRGKIYRVGGMEPRNKPGQPSENYSVADAARFDPTMKTWEALPPLPEPRSSHDVVVIGDQLIVTSGWTMEGKAGQKWLDTMQTLDLAAAKPAWKTVTQPFKRRALVAVAFERRMYVMGGITESGKVVPDVDIYDPANGQWSKGPALPGTGVNPFAPAAVVHNHELYVSVADGALYRLSNDKQQWVQAGRATPRVAHRLVSDGKSVLVIGGAKNGQNLDLIEAVAVTSESAH